ncbi:isohexenylglutaconyl-CoA hydratase [Tamilnaduibacter salinus]|uniref:Isohexenylglutaconyl-CoA hydratase n=1 Tax=Tamilnaduibacter salinus TaxID=1484056 RepID=A0A2U1CUD3_9GAMM|nr:enoyl-CoA hydratase-related protein [Tamilnaduibacter salinus]PVY70669.1 isohexenylglutaconyl-CoA hydratase [Tamilnaduibacter salinus]
MATLPNCETLTLQPEGIALMITLNRPDQRNAMSLHMVQELSAVFDAIRDDDTVRAVVLRGAGGHFCAGGDIKDMASARSASTKDGSDPFRDLNRAFGTLIQQVNEAPQVTIMLLEGAVMGGGFGLACVSDLAIADKSARFGMPETTLGVIPAQIAPFVVERIGLTQARRLALLGLRINGEEAHQLGLVHELIDGENNARAAITDTLRQIQKCAPVATATTKSLLHRVGREPMDQLLDQAATDFASAVRGPEGAEGTRAFMEKRDPSWAADGD